MSSILSTILTAADTARALPYPALARQIEALLRDPAVVVPARIVQALPGGGSRFVMPAADARVAITKLITFIPNNDQRSLPSIQGDIVVFDVTTGQRIAILDGPTVTARRTAAVSLLAARKLAKRTDGPLLVVDTRDADHEAGDLLQAGIDVSALPTLADVVLNKPAWTARPKADRQGPIFFKSCGWGGWDLAAARVAQQMHSERLQSELFFEALRRTL